MMEQRKEILSKEYVKDFTFDIIFKEFYNKFLLDNENFLSKFNFEAIFTLAGVNDILNKNFTPEETVEKIKIVINDNRAFMKKRS